MSPLVLQECNVRQVDCFSKPGAYIAHNASGDHSICKRDTTGYFQGKTQFPASLCFWRDVRCFRRPKHVSTLTKCFWGLNVDYKHGIVGKQEEKKGTFRNVNMCNINKHNIWALILLIGLKDISGCKEMRLGSCVNVSSRIENVSMWVKKNTFLWVAN